MGAAGPPHDDCAGVDGFKGGWIGVRCGPAVDVLVAPILDRSTVPFVVEKRSMLAADVAHETICGTLGIWMPH